MGTPGSPGAKAAIGKAWYVPKSPAQGKGQGGAGYKALLAEVAPLGWGPAHPSLH